MKTHVRYILTITLLFPLLLYAQGEQNIWMVNAVPRGGTYRALDFSSGNPVMTGVPRAASNAVCDAAGQPLFYIDGQVVSDRNGDVMPNGTGLIYPTAGTGYSCPPVIVPLPGNTYRYGIATHRNGGLYFTLVDMQANGGMGDVLPNQKNIPLNAFAGRNGIATDSKLIAVAGCNNTWLVSRSRFANQFRAYRITADGVDTSPVISEAGNLPLKFYEGRSFSGLMKASPDGKKLALACGLAYTNIYPSDGAIEIYDFDKCSGKISNPVVLDSGTHYYGVCFSPDNSKLYVTTFPDSGGRLYQFDLSQPTVAAIRASKTLVFENPVYWVLHFFGWDPWADPLADLKNGPDGKIYFGNGHWGGRNSYRGPSRSTGRYTGGFHVINHPNRQGLACNAVPNVIWHPGNASRDLPPDIVLPPKQDTVYGGLRQVAVCFRDSAMLQADTPGSCYRWDDGSDQAARMIDKPGIYWVQYTDGNCTLHIDSFDVRFVGLPYIGPETYSCPNERNGSITVIADDSTRFSYIWRNSVGNVIRNIETGYGDTLAGIISGIYSVQLTTTSGCDTMLNAEVLPLPLPPVLYDADTVVCKGVPLAFTNTSEAPIWEWHLGDGTISRERHIVHIYAQAGVYAAMLVTENVEGCRDTAIKNIHVKELLLSLTATPDLLYVNESTVLQTSALDPYIVTAWLPERFFTDQQSYTQHVRIDTNRTFSVIAVSEPGCIDTAEVTVATHPMLYLPTAFTPNGDGRNDVFRPAVSGATVNVRLFRIYDRWGSEVWSGQGSSDAVGWDGSYNSVPAQVGTYYYTIEAETHTGKTIRQKGDVTLVR